MIGALAGLRITTSCRDLASQRVLIAADWNTVRPGGCPWRLIIITLF